MGASRARFRWRVHAKVSHGVLDSVRGYYWLCVLWYYLSVMAFCILSSYTIELEDAYLDVA